ncbi:nuclear protein [Arthrobotrys megalospora]
MARKVVPRPYEDPFEDDQEESLYTDPYRDTIKASSRKLHPSYPPDGQLSSHDPSFNSSPSSGSFSDKENAPVPSRQRGSDTSPLVKKEKGSIARSAHSAPYPVANETMAARKPKASASSRPLTERSNTSKISKSKSPHTRRTTSAAPSRTSSRAPSIVPETPAAEESDQEMSESDTTAQQPQVDDEEEEEEEDDDEEDIPQATQRSRVSETPAPSRSTQRAPRQSQLPAASQAPASSQRPLATQYYDPNQSMAERRRVKGAYNNIQQDLADNRDKLLKQGNSGLLHYIEKANELFNDVKQTSDAMVDGKVQVEIGKIAAEKAKRVGNSNTNTGLDIDEFIAKTIQFMSKSRPGDTSDGHDWAYLGREVATPSMKTASTSDFMYGPMAVQKRQRLVKERKKVIRRRPEEYIRPIDLDEKQIAKNENSTTKNVVHVHDCLIDYLTRTGEGVIGYFDFVINPESYSQTIENMFYLAFLIRDGRVGIREDEDDGLPYLEATDPATPEEAHAKGIVRKQIVMPMEKHIWRELIEVFQLEQSVIPTRPREVEAINASGWYS